ncbi:MAG: DNA recombination protein RmuC [Planctomycetota bacterium]
MEFVWPLISVVTLLVGFFVARSLVSKQVDVAQEEVARLREEVSDHQAEAASLRDEISGQQAEVMTARENLVRADAEKKAAESQLQQLRADRESLEKSMQAFSADQLEKNRKQFLDHAEQRLGVSETKHVSELEKRHESIEKQFLSLREHMEKFQEQHQRIEKNRTESFSSLNEQVKLLAEQTVKVGAEAASLSTALKGSGQTRGRWGEIALENICELAGMTKHCDFTLQDQEGTGKRPDLVVNMPGKGKIPIDAKVPFAAYDRAMESTDPTERDAEFEAHGKVVRSTMLDLAKRDYPTVVGGKVDFTVMFIPIESVAAAAFAVQPNLQEEAMKNKILIATPVTLIALLKTVALYWKQEELAENAQKIWEESSQLHDRLKTFTDHFGKVGGNLTKALNAYNSAVGSYQGRVLPKARSIESMTMKTGSKDTLPDLSVIGGVVRGLDSDSAVLDHVPADDEE